MWLTPGDGWFRPPGRDPGPRRTEDVRLTLDAVQRLQSDGLTRGERISVGVQLQVVMLTGSVSTPEVRDAAACVVREVHGVRDVVNDLRLPDGRRGDVLDDIVMDSHPARRPLPALVWYGILLALIGLAVRWQLAVLVAAVWLLWALDRPTARRR